MPPVPMAITMLRSSSRYFQRTCIQQCARLSTSRSKWFHRFLSPKEENELYFGITSAFRKKLGEKSNESKQSYANLIESVILAGAKNNKSGKMALSIGQLGKLKQDLDAAGKAKDLAHLHTLRQQMDNAEVDSVAMYNRLIRAYIAAGSVQDAEKVLKGLRERKLMPSRRTFTYLIQAYMNSGQLRRARKHVEHMQHLSYLQRMRDPFDLSVMLRYHIQSNETHAVELLWSNIKQHDISKLGMTMCTQYLEWLIHQNAKSNQLASCLQDILPRLDLTHPPNETHLNIISQCIHRVLSQYPDVAESTLLSISQAASHQRVLDAHIVPILQAYITNDQHLKAIGFYHRLMQSNANIPTEASTMIKQVRDRLLQEDIAIPAEYNTTLLPCK